MKPSSLLDADVLMAGVMGAVGIGTTEWYTPGSVPIAPQASVWEEHGGDENKPNTSSLMLTSESLASLLETVFANIDGKAHEVA